MRLKVIGYYQGKYLYALPDQGILLSFKDYTIVEQNEMVALTAWNEKGKKTIYKNW